MARIPADQIERMKSDISLLQLIESQGYLPRKQGKDHAISCPFHKGDDTPSLIISPKTNLFNCFGCGAAGSVIDWVMKTQSVSFRFACELLQKYSRPEPWVNSVLAMIVGRIVFAGSKLSLCHHPNTCLWEVCGVLETPDVDQQMKLPSLIKFTK